MDPLPPYLFSEGVDPLLREPPRPARELGWGPEKADPLKEDQILPLPPPAKSGQLLRHAVFGRRLFEGVRAFRQTGRQLQLKLRRQSPFFLCSPPALGIPCVYHAATTPVALIATFAALAGSF